LLLLGLARINPFGWFPKIAVTFGNNAIFGWLLVVSGIAILATFPWRLHLSGKIVAAVTAAVNAAWGLAVFNASPISGLIAAVLTFVLLVEAGAYE
jgi:hypothetical protein